MSLTTKQVQDLIEEAKKVQREQDKIQAKIESVSADIASQKKSLNEEFGIEPEELPKKIEETEAELMKLAEEYGLAIT